MATSEWKNADSILNSNESTMFDSQRSCIMLENIAMTVNSDTSASKTNFQLLCVQSIYVCRWCVSSKHTKKKKMFNRQHCFSKIGGKWLYNLHQVTPVAMPKKLCSISIWTQERYIDDQSTNLSTFCMISFEIEILHSLLSQNLQSTRQKDTSHVCTSMEMMREVGASPMGAR